MDDLGRMFDPSPPGSNRPNAFVFTFVQPTKSQKITYREQQELLRIALEEEDKFNDGFILDTIERGVHHPVIHVKRLTTEETPCRSKTFLTIRDEKVVAIERNVGNDNDEEKEQDAKLSSSVDLLQSNALGPDVCVQQGVFKELKRIEPDYSFSKRDRLEHRAFLLVGMRNIEPRITSVLENWWRDWTGARSIYLKLRNEHDLGRIIFYRRVSPCKDLSFFAYLVLAECWNVTPKNELRMFDFVQRIRVEHINAYISLYRDLDVTPTSTSGKSLVADDVTSGQKEELAETVERRLVKKSRGFQTNLEWRKEFEVNLKAKEAER